MSTPFYHARNIEDIRYEMPEPQVFDPIITEDYLKNTCKFKQGKLTCAYLMMAPGGFRCAKDDRGFEAAIVKRLEEGTMRATGDNCLGWEANFIGSILGRRAPWRR